MIVLVMLFAVITVCIIPILKERKTYVTPCGIPCKQKYPKQDFPQETAPKHSVTEYLERIENEHTQILKEREIQNPYAIILWWGLDGLRINQDNSLEWVNKPVERKQTCKSSNDLLSFLNGAMNLTPQGALQSMVSSCCVDTQCQSFSDWRVQDMCQCTQSQLQSLQLAQAQQAQNASILNALDLYCYRTTFPPAYQYYFYGDSQFGQMPSSINPLKSVKTPPPITQTRWY